MSDLISKNDLFVAIVEKGQESKQYKIGETWKLNLQEIKETIEKIPVINDERLMPKEPVFKTGESVAFVDYADRTGEAKVNKWAEWCCPTCGWFVGEQYVPRKHNQQKSNFCSRCGQAIDWDAVEPEKYALHEKQRKELEEVKKALAEIQKKVAIKG